LAKAADDRRSHEAAAATACDVSFAELRASFAELRARLEALAAPASADESRHHGAAAPASALAAQVLAEAANENRRHAAATPAPVLAAQASVDKSRCHGAAAPASALAAQVLAEAANKNCRHAAARPRPLRCWLRRRQSTKAIAMGRPHLLQRWQHRCWRRRPTKTVAMRRPCLLQHWWDRRRPTNVRASRPAGASDLAVALDVGTVLARPVQSTRFLPPAHSVRGGGLHCRL
jgi:hypothetical protein